MCIRDSQTFRPKGVKSQGFGDSVPDSIDALFLLFVAPLIDVTCPGRSQPASGSQDFGAAVPDCKTGNSVRSRRALPSPTRSLKWTPLSRPFFARNKLISGGV